VRIVYNKM